MNEITLKNIYVCMRNGYPDYTTLSYWKKNSISSLLKHGTITWKELRKYGWTCEKVNIHFEKINKS